MYGNLGWYAAYLTYTKALSLNVTFFSEVEIIVLFLAKKNSCSCGIKLYVVYLL